MVYKITKMLEEKDLTGRDFVGVSEGDDGEIGITVPYGIDVPSGVDSSDTKNMRFLKTYVKSIQRALNSDLVKNEIKDVSVGMKHPLAAVKIVCDYITMGPIIEYIVEEKRSTTGKMDINRTIQKIVPSYINGELIYDEYITRRKQVFTEGFVARIQGNVINHFMEHGGEILFGTKLKVAVKPVKLDSTVVTKLRRELLQTFNSRNQSVIRWMIDYIRGLEFTNKTTQNSKWNYAIIASTLWESIILSVYGNQYPVVKSKYGKRYSFQSIATGEKIYTGSPTQHDTLYEDDNQVIIIDAKMYGNPKNLLSEEVLGKQFGYYVEAKKRNPHKRVINVLFAPYIPERDENSGFADWVITDPHVSAVEDPDRLIFLYRCSANSLINDYYFSRKRYDDFQVELGAFINKPEVRAFLTNRGASY